MTEREILVRILDDSDPEGGTFPGPEEDLETFWGAQADAILDSNWLRKVKADAIREAAIKAQESFIAEQGGIGYARVRTSWLFDEADRIQG